MKKFYIVEKMGSRYYFGSKTRKGKVELTDEFPPCLYDTSIHARLAIIAYLNYKGYPFWIKPNGSVRYAHASFQSVLLTRLVEIHPHEKPRKTK